MFYEERVEGFFSLSCFYTQYLFQIAGGWGEQCKTFHTLLSRSEVNSESLSPLHP